MKKWISFIMVLFLAFIFVGCGEEKPDPTPNPDDGDKVKVTSIEVSGIVDGQEMEVDDVLELEVKILPENASNKNYRVAALDASVLKVEDNKKVTALKSGETTLTVTPLGNTSLKKEYKVTVKGEVVVVVVNPESFVIGGKTEVEMGKTTALSVTPTPSNASREAVWTSSDESIATVNNGIVKGISLGEATITATSTLDENVKAKYKITVIEPQGTVIITPTSITVEGDDEVEVGYSIRLVASVQPAGADPNLVWESRNPEIATVDDKGNVKGVSVGTTYITAYSAVDNNVKSSKYKVKVIKDPISSIPIVDLQGYNIVMMASSSGNSLDPFLDGYTASDKMYRQKAWREIEAKYGCTITVNVYPADASWGPTRITWINSQAELGQAQADFMQVDPTWLKDFAASGAMHATTTYFSKYGKNQMEPALKQAATYKGELYAVSVGLSESAVYPVNGIFYNYGLIQKYKLESPAKLFNEGRWTYEDFVSWCLAAQAVLEDDMWAVSGAPQIYWYGMTEASGVKIADTTTIQLNLTHQYSVDAIDALKQIVLGGGWDTLGIDFDEKVASFQNGKALMQCGQVWFVKEGTRFPADLWGDDTQYGYVPFPYHSNVGKERSFVNYVDQDIYMMCGAREFNHPANITYEDIYRPVQEMFLNTINYQKEDSTYDAQLIRTQIAQKRMDDPESVEALLYYTAEKTLYDPIFNGIEYYYSGSFQSAIQKSVVNNTDFIQAMNELEADVYNKFISIYG